MSAGYTSSFGSLPVPIPELPNDSAVVRWYAVYTAANHEKHVSKQLGLRGVEHFLPLYVSTSQWKDRRVTLQRPLFPGYVFIRMSLRDRQKTHSIPGISRLVGFGSTPTPLPDEEIEALQTSVTAGVRLHPHPFLTVGRRVQVNCGPLTGLKGRIVRRKGKSRFVISIAFIQRAVWAELDELDLSPVSQKPASSLRANNVINQVG